MLVPFRRRNGRRMQSSSARSSSDSQRKSSPPSIDSSNLARQIDQLQREKPLLAAALERAVRCFLRGGML